MIRWHRFHSIFPLIVHSIPFVYSFVHSHRFWNQRNFLILMRKEPKHQGSNAINRIVSTLWQLCHIHRIKSSRQIWLNNTLFSLWCCRLMCSVKLYWIYLVLVLACWIIINVHRCVDKDVVSWNNKLGYGNWSYYRSTHWSISEIG